MSASACLVVAKAPVPGQVKTRLASTVGDDVAAALAAASLLDTLDVCRDTFDRCILALSGDLGEAVAGDEIRRALEDWTVLAQRGTGLAARLEHAHVDAYAVCRVPIVQVGMDTPHVSRAELKRVATPLERGSADAVLGPARDGGWWALGLAHPRWTAGLGSVEMSSSRTGEVTRALLRGNGARLRIADTLRDIDDATDADALRSRIASTRFGRAWRELATAARP